MRKLGQLTEKLPLVELIEQVWAETGYMAQLKAESSPEAERRQENLEEFLGLAAEFSQTAPEASLAEFLAAVSLYTDQDAYDMETKTVALMNFHSAKGLEFPVVFLVGMEEGLFPHSRSLHSQKELEEERRLCYVGLTSQRAALFDPCPQPLFVWHLPVMPAITISGSAAA